MNNEFSWSAAREARIDRAIDRAVREMMQIDPPAGLRWRVLARLDGPSGRRAYFPARYAFAVVAIVVLVLSLITAVPDHIEPPAPPKAPVMATIGPAPAIQPPMSWNASPASRPTPPITRELIRMPRVTNVFADRPGEVTAATTATGHGTTTRGLAPGALPSLKIVPLSERPIVIEPLVLPALQKDRQ